MTYLAFIRSYSRILTFAVFLAFFSSFGQTFLLSIYLPEFVRAFDLTEGGIGILYGLATVCSALLLPISGRYIDRIPLTRYTLAVTAGLALVSFLIAAAPHWIVLFLGLWGLRHFGQGLCGHIALTTAGRCFASNRGKAVGIAGTGFSLGEFMLPTLVTLAVATVGWRLSWGLSGLIILLVLAPVSIRLIRASRRVEDVLPSTDNDEIAPEVLRWRSRTLLVDPRFYLILVTLLPIGFFSTGFIFYQSVVAQQRGWGEHVFPIAFAGFAVTRTILTIGSGPLIDRFRAVRLLPAHMIFLLLSATVLFGFEQEWAGYAYLILLGVMMGIGQNIGSAVWAEVYGVANLGGIRSMSSMIAVLSTALAPLMFGALLSFNVGIQTILGGSVVAILVLTILSFFAAASLSRYAER